MFFDFDLKQPQRAIIASQQSKFSNIRADEVFIPTEFCASKNLWILKPACMSRGRGLELFSDLKQLSVFIKMYLSGYDAKDFKQMKYNHKLERSPSLKTDVKPNQNLGKKSNLY